MRSKTNSIFIQICLLAFIFLLGYSCKNEKDVKAEKEEEIEEIIETKKAELLYAWVDKLNLRDAPSSKGKSIGSVQSSEALKYYGEKSEDSVAFVLRGVLYEEPWLKVETESGEVGWVFGGAVKKANEEKGNEQMSDTNFDFTHFGNFNLKEWKNLGTKDESGGDADIKTTTYKRRSLKLELSKVEVGEYGYQRIYKLIDANGRTVKERVFKYLADVNFGELIEEVKDFTSNPPKLHKRTQNVGKHYLQLNAKPLMVNGEWEETTLASANN